MYLPVGNLERVDLEMKQLMIGYQLTRRKDETGVDWGMIKEDVIELVTNDQHLHCVDGSAVIQPHVLMYSWVKDNDDDGYDGDFPFVIVVNIVYPQSS
jgi:hypothetical protein